MRIACVIAMMAGVWLLMPQRGYALLAMGGGASENGDARCPSSRVLLRPGTHGVRPGAVTVSATTKTSVRSNASASHAGALNSLMTGDGTYVYYAEQSVDPNEGPVLRKVSRVRADGSGYACIYEGGAGDFISDLKLSDNRLVVSMGDNIVSMKTDGGDAHVIVAAASGYPRGARFAVDAGKVFYPTIADSGAWEIRSCTVDGSASSRVYSGNTGQGEVGPQIEGATSGKVVFMTGEQQPSSNAYLYSVLSVPADGGDAIEIGRTLNNRVAVSGGRVYIMDGTLESMQADGKSRYRICQIPGNGYSPIYNIGDGVAYVGMGKTMWRVSLSSGDSTSLGKYNGVGQMEIVDGQVYIHYGIEGAIRKVDASLADQGYFRQP